MLRILLAGALLSVPGMALAQAPAPDAPQAEAVPAPAAPEPAAQAAPPQAAPAPTPEVAPPPAPEAAPSTAPQAAPAQTAPTPAPVQPAPVQPEPAPAPAAPAAASAPVEGAPPGTAAQPAPHPPSQPAAPAAPAAAPAPTAPAPQPAPQAGAPAPAAAASGEPAAAAVAPAQPTQPAPSALAPLAPVPAAGKAPVYLPNLYDVTVVATWDTLNIREAPDGQAKVIATLPATAKGVEVVARDPSGKWGKVNAGERSGWVAMRFLKPQPGLWQPGALPQSLVCTGTEPMWSLKAGKALVLAEPDQPPRELGLRKVMDRGIPGEPTRGLIAGDDKGRLTAFLRPAQCSDGMSERAYGLAVAVILDGQEMPSRMLTGCCTIGR